MVFALSSGTFDGLPIDTQQRFELLLTAAQSLFAVSILITLGLTVRGAVALFVLFSIQFFSSITLSPQADQTVIVVLSAVYGVLAIGNVIWHRRELLRTGRDGLVTPFSEMAGADDEMANR